MLRTFAALILALFVANCASNAGHSHDSMAGKSGWCQDCKVGFIEGKEVKCQGCFNAMNSGGIGWCEGCNVGYIDGKKVKCKGCVDAKKSGGECKACQEHPKR